MRRCPGGYTEPALIGYYRSAELRRLVMVAAEKATPGETTICSAAGVFDLGGGGDRPGPVRPASTATPLTVAVGASGGYGMVHGHTGKDAVRVRFRDRPSLLELPVIQSWSGYDVNLYVGLFPSDWVPVDATAFDAVGRQLAGCAFLGCPAG